MLRAIGFTAPMNSAISSVVSNPKRVVCAVLGHQLDQLFVAWVFVSKVLISQFPQVNYINYSKPTKLFFKLTRKFVVINACHDGVSDES